MCTGLLVAEEEGQVNFVVGNWDRLPDLKDEW